MRGCARRFVFGLMLAGSWLTGQAAAAPADDGELPSFAQVRAAWRPSDLPLLDRRGQPLQTLRIDTQARRLNWVPLEDVSPALLAALVHSEDRRFWSHSGVDWSALLRSAWQSALNERTQGGSTLTMQLAGLLDPALARPAGGRTVGRKLSQIGRAQALEAHWRKSEIFEAYLNLVPLRGEAVGLAAASQTLFAKYPSGLDAQEAALLAALVRSPNAKAGALTRRACELLRSMGPTQPAACEGLDWLAATALARRAQPPLGEQLAPHAARLAWQQWQQQNRSTAKGSAGSEAAAARPAQLITTLDAGLQRLARLALRAQLTELQGHAVQDGAVLVLDNASGAVLAWVGSAGLHPEAREVDAVLARRQPGSTLKPFVYEMALEQRLITPASLLLDAPAQLSAGGGLYLPQNYDKQHHGWVRARTALASSLNVPAVQVGAMLGPDPLFARLNALGLALRHSGGHHGHALALGSAEVTLADLSNAYRALANQGRWSPWRLLPGPAAPSRPVADPAAVFQISQILSDNTARAPTFGLDSPLVTRGFAAVKTGTSKDLRDNWCIGYTDRYTVGVWVGNADGSPMRQVSGSTGAAPIWRSLVSQLHEASPSRPPPVPAGVVSAVVQRAGEAPLQEWFIAGTEPPPSVSAAANDQVAAGAAGAAGSAFGIRSPLDGSLFALDPDIPGPLQRIVFSGAPGDWYLDGRLIGRTTAARPTLDWAPWPGRHRLSLRRQGVELQAIAFEVRGATLRPGRARAAPAQYSAIEQGATTR
ncbi:penicillin-binding protein 1C [Ideonella sp.]|uniref:penicillin-binding protein 1C n=1 Tax=Ideonella sp. TaxID=1929293 RepID=UPI003BB63497